MLPIDALWVISSYSFCYFENVTNWCSVNYFYYIPSVILIMLPIHVLWVIVIIFFLLFWKCYQLMLCELFLSYSFCYFENVTNWCSVSYFYYISSVILKMLPIDALWVIFIIFLLLFWKCYQLMLCELFLSYFFCYFENVISWCLSVFGLPIKVCQVWII